MKAYVVVVEKRNSDFYKVSQESFASLELARQSIRRKGIDYVGEQFKSLLENDIETGWLNNYVYYGMNNIYRIVETDVKGVS